MAPKSKRSPGAASKQSARGGASRSPSPPPKVGASTASPLARWRAQPREEVGSWIPPPFAAQLEAIGLATTLTEGDCPRYAMAQKRLYPAKYSGNSMMEELEKILQPMDELFPPIPPVESGMWLYSSKEVPQTFEDYVRERPNLPSRAQNTIYLLPFSDPVGDPGLFGTFPDLGILCRFVESWFMLPCRVLPPNAVHKQRGVRSKKNGHGDDRQYNANDILPAMRSLVPRDAYCLIGVTMEDIWSGELHFVFGLASLKDRVGVFSFCRQDPAWYRISCRVVDMKIVKEYPKEREEGDADTVMRRAHGTLSHEIGHQFGIRHCQFFCCRMRGSNGLVESDSWGGDLCPVCLQKLSWCIASGTQKDLPTSPSEWCTTRYHRLLDHYRSLGEVMLDSFEWTRRRLQHLEADQAIGNPQPTLEKVDYLNASVGTTDQISDAAHVEADNRESTVRSIFRTHANDRGEFGMSDFTKMLRILDPRLTDQRVNELFAAADANNDDILNVEEFMDWLYLPQDDPRAAEAVITNRLLAETKLVRSCSGSCDVHHA